MTTKSARLYNSVTVDDHAPAPAAGDRSGPPDDLRGGLGPR
ncbi:hypothetical protein ACFZCG_17490 [Streptomyces tanashiensis]